MKLGWGQAWLGVGGLVWAFGSWVDFFLADLFAGAHGQAELHQMKTQKHKMVSEDDDGRTEDDENVKAVKSGRRAAVMGKVRDVIVEAVGQHVSGLFGVVGWVGARSKGQHEGQNFGIE